MAKIVTSKCKLCRRAGEKLFLKGDRCSSPKCALVRKAYIPGAHGNAVGGGMRRGLSEYGKQLKEKQKLKRIYGISEKQLRRHLELSRKKEGVLGDNLLGTLESRLDNIVYRLGIAQSRAQARQLVSHGLFEINGKKLNVPSAMLKVGDKVSVRKIKVEKNFIKDAKTALKKSSANARWMELDADKMEGKILARPTKDEMGISVDVAMVIEFYSR
jgi:small subunit ribosomal protein S4